MQKVTQGEGRDADFTIPSGCALCGGDIHVRRTPGHAGAVCMSCHVISRPVVEHVMGGLVFHDVVKAKA